MDRLTVRRQVWAGVLALLAGTGLLILGAGGGFGAGRSAAGAPAEPALSAERAFSVEPASSAESASSTVPVPQPLRFQVLANSNSAADQALKVRVRDAVLPLLQHAGQEADDAQAFLANLPGLLPEIEAAAGEALVAAGSRQSVTAQFAVVAFPARRYGPVAFPAGEYPTLRLVLGKGEGHNWWCVLFPPLCFPEAAGHIEWRGENQPPAVDAQSVSQALAAADSPLILEEREIDELPVEARWALVDWLRAHGWLGE